MEIARETAKKRTFTMYKDIDEKLNELAKKYKASRSRIIEYLIVQNYENLMNKKIK